jgi:hypothetical protein
VQRRLSGVRFGPGAYQARQQAPPWASYDLLLPDGMIATMNHPNARSPRQPRARKPASIENRPTVPPAPTQPAVSCG